MSRDKLTARILQRGCGAETATWCKDPRIKIFKAPGHYKESQKGGGLKMLYNVAVPSTHVRVATTICNISFRGSDTLFSLLYSHAYISSPQCKILKEKKKGRKERKRESEQAGHYAIPLISVLGRHRQTALYELGASLIY